MHTRAPLHALAPVLGLFGFISLSSRVLSFAKITVEFLLLVLMLLVFSLQALHRELCDVYRRLGELSGLSHAKNDNKGTHGGWTTTSDSKSSRSRDGSSKSSTGATEGATSRDQVARAAKLLMEAQQAFVWPRPATMATASAAAASAAAARKGSVGEGHGADDGDATATLSDAMAAAYGFSTSAAGPAPAAASVAPAREAQVAWAVQGVLDEWQQRQLTEHSTGVHNRSSREKQYGDTAGIKDQHDHDDDDEDSDDVAFGDEDVSGCSVSHLSFITSLHLTLFAMPLITLSPFYCSACVSCHPPPQQLDALIRGAAYTAAISIVVVAALQARKSPLAVQVCVCLLNSYFSLIVLYFCLHCNPPTPFLSIACTEYLAFFFLSYRPRWLRQRALLSHLPWPTLLLQPPKWLNGPCWSEVILKEVYIVDKKSPSVLS